MKKTNQEEALEFISTAFKASVSVDRKIDPNDRKAITDWWEEAIINEPIIGLHLLQAITNFLWEIDKKMESAHKAGIVMAITRLELVFNANPIPGGESIIAELVQLLKEESNPEVTELTDVDKVDLSEVGGNDEDDTPLV